MKYLILILIVSLSGCAKPPPLSQAEGELKPINSEGWINQKMLEYHKQEKERDERTEATN